MGLRYKQSFILKTPAYAGVLKYYFAVLLRKRLFVQLFIVFGQMMFTPLEHYRYRIIFPSAGREAPVLTGFSQTD